MKGKLVNILQSSSSNSFPPWNCDNDLHDKLWNVQVDVIPIHRVTAVQMSEIKLLFTIVMLLYWHIKQNLQVQQMFSSASYF